MLYKNTGTSFIRLSQITRLTNRRRTDGQTDSFIVTRPPCIQCIQNLHSFRRYQRGKNGLTDALMHAVSQIA